MDDGVAAMLRTLDGAFPPVERMSARDARAAVAARRQTVDNVDDAIAQDRCVDVENGTVAVRVYRPLSTSRAPRAGVVFLHGGGFVLCDIDSHDGFCRAMSRHTDSVVVSVNYRLAPEHAAPTAALDALAAFDWAVRNAEELGLDPHRVAVAGDSAGGNLAAAVSIARRNGGAVLPAAQILLYPMMDPACDSPSHRRRATGCATTHAALQWYWHQYLGGSAIPDPAYLVAPPRADSMVDLPPAVVVTASLDPLHDEGVAYARRLRSAGVPVVHRDYRGLFHGFLSMMSFPPAREGRRHLWADMREMLHSRTPEVAT